jgi:outer membrane protein assembly factor BamE (lipoprotein component of BamABCDE complex)
MSGAPGARVESCLVKVAKVSEGMAGAGVLCSLSMTIRLLLVFAVSLVLPVRAPAADVPPATVADKKTEPTNPWETLKPGQTADSVRALLGDPVEVRPMASPKGKAEVWVYISEVSRRVDRIDVSTPDVVINVTESDGSVRQRITPGLVRFQDVHYLTEDVSELLLFDDRYVVHKVTRRERKL